MRRIDGTLAAILALTTLGAGPLAAQYFGQNKVQYRTFDFKIIQTEHFEIYYYPEERSAALDAARMAERGYARLSRILHHQFQGRKPIIVYASSSDMQQTNAADVGSAVAVTEFFKHRMVLPFQGDYAEFEHVLQHEMVHQFQFDIYSRGHPGGGVQTLISVNPPLWFMEGMAEYLSLGPINPETAMWLRDASLEGHLPTIEELSYGDIFPYHYGHALWAYIGEKWGDEVIGEILQTSATSGVEAAFKRALGLSLDELSADWRDAVQTTFLPQLGDHYRARRVAQAALTRKRSRGRIFLAPALTPDGREMAFFGDQGGFFIDLFLADAETGRVKRRLVKSTINKNYEDLRFINSAGTFSPDGRFFALAAKRRDRDDLVILDVKRGREVQRIKINLNGLQTPSWSPDGKQLVFTGFDGGLGDLYIINRDGTGLRRLTNDKYADLHPAWSPDGKTIAFVTDRGSHTDFDQLRFGNLRIALYHLDAGTIELLGHMDEGKNIDPAWAPDGQSLAFVSDRTGISDIYLYDLTDGNIYQLTNLYTGVQGITPLSPVLSWARQADRLAFVYYEDGQYSVYSVENPRSLRGTPFRGPAVRVPVSLVAARAARDAARDTAGHAAPGAASTGTTGTAALGAPTARFREPGPPRHDRIHIAALSRPLHRRLRGAADRRLPTRQLRPRILRRHRGLPFGHSRQPHDRVIGCGEWAHRRSAVPGGVRQPGASLQLGDGFLAGAALLLRRQLLDAPGLRECGWHGQPGRAHDEHPSVRHPRRLRRVVLSVQPLQPGGARLSCREHQRRDAPTRDRVLQSTREPK